MSGFVSSQPAPSPKEKPFSPAGASQVPQQAAPRQASEAHTPCMAVAAKQAGDTQDACYLTASPAG